MSTALVVVAGVPEVFAGCLCFGVPPLRSLTLPLGRFDRVVPGRRFLLHLHNLLFAGFRYLHDSSRAGGVSLTRLPLREADQGQTRGTPLGGHFSGSRAEKWRGAVTRTPLLSGPARAQAATRATRARPCSRQSTRPQTNDRGEAKSAPRTVAGRSRRPLASRTRATEPVSRLATLRRPTAL